MVFAGVAREKGDNNPISKQAIYKTKTHLSPIVII